MTGAHSLRVAPQDVAQQRSHAHDSGLTLGNGLRGMKERVEAAKGQMLVQTSPGAGFGVSITLPLGACT